MSVKLEANNMDQEKRLLDIWNDNGWKQVVKNSMEL